MDAICESLLIRCIDPAKVTNVIFSNLYIQIYIYAHSDTLCKIYRYLASPGDFYIY